MRVLALALVVAAGQGCATLGPVETEPPVLPTSGVGPFRALEPEEVRTTAPFVLDDGDALYREPAVMREGDATVLYAVARAPAGADVIVRTRALDARTFTTPPRVVLAPEGDERALGGPAVVRRGAEVLLYYATASGIRLARSTDGLGFTRAGPVLGADPSSTWETTPPRAPSVVILPDGRLRMFYAAGIAIGEAESTDGVAWRRRGPVLAPAAPVDPAGRPPFDAAAVGDPCAVLRITPAGRLHVRVLYTGVDASGATAIGFAGRFGEDGPLARQPVPAFTAGAAPALLDLGDRSFLYVEDERREGAAPGHAALAAALAPATATLPPPVDPPAGP